MKDLEQLRAADAWMQIPKGSNKEYVNSAKSAPALIMNNGLMQTLAFLKSKGKDDLCNHVCSWLLTQVFNSNEKVNPQQLFDAIMIELHRSDSLVYRRATEEALAYLRWVRQFASALTKE
jgi:CRISPR-associated protein Cmr5